MKKRNRITRAIFTSLAVTMIIFSIFSNIFEELSSKAYIYIVVIMAIISFILNIITHQLADKIYKNKLEIMIKINNSNMNIHSKNNTDKISLQHQYFSDFISNSLLVRTLRASMAAFVALVLIYVVGRIMYDDQDQSEILVATAMIVVFFIAIWTRWLLLHYRVKAGYFGLNGYEAAMIVEAWRKEKKNDTGGGDGHLSRGKLIRNIDEAERAPSPGPLPQGRTV